MDFKTIKKKALTNEMELTRLRQQGFAEARQEKPGGLRKIL
jgi:hypothetical protein